MNLAQKLIDILKKDNVLLTGGAGVGKSYLVGEVVSELRKVGKQVVVLGSTGVSAVNVGGQTLHSFLPLASAIILMNSPAMTDTPRQDWLRSKKC